MDSRSGITTVYYYDLIGRLVGYHETSDTLDHQVTYSYDEQDRPKAMKETINGYTKNYTYTYNKEDKLASMTVDGITLNYTYDAFGRLSKQTKVYDGKTVKTNNIQYTGTDTTTSNQISTFNSWEYTYNNKGYIASVTPDANTTNYTYNSAGFLIREDNQKLGKSFRWRYDKAGNITAKETYEHTTGTLGTPLETITYTYGNNDGWDDLLTAYNGQALTYNDMGSLKSDGTWNYYWKRGRELGSMVSDDTTWTYSYNGDGIRIGRTDGTNTYTYIYDGSRLTRVQYNGKLVRYNYDESGRPISLRYNNVLYFIDTNLQGDVVGIRQTSDNARVVNYVYDAYGKICSITGSMKDTLGVHNVLRYRGYVYDQETGLYYVSSRYYNPEIGRWISPEPNVYAGAFDSGSGLTGYNVYAYCANDPVNFSDPTGEFALGVILGKAVIGAAVNVLTTYIGAKVTGQSYSWKDAGVAALAGALGTGRPVLKVAAGVVSGLYTGVTAYQNGADPEKAVLAGAVSAWGTTMSVANIAGWTGPALELGVSTFTDLVFGTASNSIAAATYRASIETSTSNNTRQQVATQRANILNRTKLYCDTRLR